MVEVDKISITIDIFMKYSKSDNSLTFVYILLNFSLSVKN